MVRARKKSQSSVQLKRNKILMFLSYKNQVTTLFKVSPVDAYSSKPEESSDVSFIAF